MDELTADDFRRVFRRDDAGRLFWVAPPKNHAEKAGAEAGFLNRGTAGNKDYWHVNVFGRTLKRSRVIFFMENGHWPNPCVDHINGDSTDDRPENLRACSLKENAANRKQAGGKFPRGVSRTRQGRFMARVSVNGRPRSFGTFDTVEQASAAAQTARQEVFGGFA